MTTYLIHTKLTPLSMTRRKKREDEKTWLRKRTYYTTFDNNNDNQTYQASVAVQTRTLMAPSANIVSVNLRSPRSIPA